MSKEKKKNKKKNKKINKTSMLISLALLVITALFIIVFAVIKSDKKREHVNITDELPKKCVLSFDSNGGNYIESKELDCGVKVGDFQIPVKDGFKFIGWMYNEQIIEQEFELNDNALLVAEWEVVDGVKIVTVKFDSDGGTSVKSIELKKGGKISQPLTPTKKGYVFLGWYNGKERFDFSKEINSDITLTAKWKEISEIKNDVNSSSSSNSADDSNQVVIVDSDDDCKVTLVEDAVPYYICPFEHGNFVVNGVLYEDKCQNEKNIMVDSISTKVCDEGYTLTSNGKCESDFVTDAITEYICSDGFYYRYTFNHFCVSETKIWKNQPKVICPDNYYSRKKGSGYYPHYECVSSFDETNVVEASYSCPNNTTEFNIKLVNNSDEVYCSSSQYRSFGESGYPDKKLYSCSENGTIENTNKCHYHYVEKVMYKYTCPNGYHLQGISTGFAPGTNNCIKDTPDVANAIKKYRCNIGGYELRSDNKCYFEYNAC